MTTTYRQRREVHDEREPLTPLQSRFTRLPVAAEASLNRLPLLLTTLGAVALGVYSLFGFAWNMVIAVAGILITSLGVVLTLRRQVMHTDLEREISRLEGEKGAIEEARSCMASDYEGQIARIQETVDSDKRSAREVLAEAARSICGELDVWDTSTRLSLYCHDEKSKEFVRLARVSDNPALESTGRTSYPSDQGFISEAWQEKEAINVTMPKIRRHWESYQANQYGLDPDTVCKLTMHSRCMIGVRIDYKDTRVGVVILESTVESRLEPTHLDKLKDSNVLTEALSRLFVVSKFALRSSAMND